MDTTPTDSIESKELRAFKVSVLMAADAKSAPTLFSLDLQATSSRKAREAGLEQVRRQHPEMKVLGATATRASVLPSMVA